MKISFIKLFVLFILGVSSLCASAQTGSRQTILFNSNWKFYKGDAPGADQPAFNDQNWHPLNLPHDWSIEGPFDEKWASATGFLPAGIGWYRKTFSAPAGTAGKKLYLYFEGVYNNSEVWINGHYLGKRPNGFISFEYEITPYLNKGGKNTIAVKVDHTQFADSRWYTGSGIYRDVYLVAVNPVHITNWGMKFTTPRVSAQGAQNKVAVMITNMLAAGTNVLVKAVMRSLQNKVVATARQNVKVSAGQRANSSPLIR